MTISLIKATLKDSDIIHKLQIESFEPLLKKYKDFNTSPGNETLEEVVSKIKDLNSDYYIIQYDNVPIGGIRIVKVKNNIYRISTIFIMPKYQGRGFAQKVITMIENIYDKAEIFKLDTIQQEKNLCYLYKKLGYIRTDETKKINYKLTIVFYYKNNNCSIYK